MMGTRPVSAPMFHNGVCPEVFRGALYELDKRDNAAIYIPSVSETFCTINNPLLFVPVLLIVSVCLFVP